MDSIIESLFKSNSVNDAISPVHFLGGIMGMNPFKLSVTSGKPKTVLSIPFCVFAGLMVSFYYYHLLASVFFKRIVSIPKYGKTFEFGELSQIYVGCLTVTLIHIMTYLKRDFFSVHFEFAEKIRKIFTNLRSQKNYSFLKLKFYIASIIQFGVCLFLIGVSYMVTATLPKVERLQSVVIILWPPYTVAMTQFTATSFMYITWLNMHTLNEEINKLLVLPQLISPVTGIPNKYFIKIRLEKLDLISKAYAHICTNSNNLESYFSLVLLAVITLSFINTVFNTFYVIHLIRTVIKFTNFNIIIYRSTKCIMNAIHMSVLAIGCKICETEVIFISVNIVK